MNRHPKWWRQYKRKQYNRTNTMSKEIIIRSTIREISYDFLNNCSMPGYRYLIDTKLGKKERYCGIIVLIVVTSLLIFSLRTTWMEMLGRPLIVTMESSQYPIEHMDFPGVALCNVNRISKRAAKEDAKMLLQPLFPDIPLVELEKYVMQLGKLIDYDIEGTHDLLSVVNKIPSNYFKQIDFIQRMLKLTPSCEKMLVRCMWAGEIRPCEELFKMRRTDQGFCCVFNYIMGFNSMGRATKMFTEAKRQTIEGSFYGLNVLLDPQLDDYGYPIHNYLGVNVLIFDSASYPDHSSTRLIHRIADPDMSTLFELQSRKQIATAEVRKYSLNTRKCLFRDERPKEFGELYTYSSCIITCRLKTIQTLCKCTPFFLPVSNNTRRICTLADLLCLNKYKEKFLYQYPVDPETEIGLEEEMQDSLFCRNCLPDCEITRHRTRAISLDLKTNIKSLPNAFVADYIERTNSSNFCHISVYHATSDGILDRLDVVFYWYELLSNFGGTAGLLVGYCIISTVEFFYFTIIRFFVIIRHKLRQHN